jgi:hypothetical protein
MVRSVLARARSYDSLLALLVLARGRGLGLFVASLLSLGLRFRSPRVEVRVEVRRHDAAQVVLELDEQGRADRGRLDLGEVLAEEALAPLLRKPRTCDEGLERKEKGGKKGGKEEGGRTLVAVW